MDGKVQPAEDSSREGAREPVKQAVPGVAAKNSALGEEKLLGFYMELTGCSECEARSTYMHVEPAEEGAPGA
jgi:hypothetical protein